ncbi:hypothetical protein Poli38472_001280 [Pythium oligandrum]|uniref:Uncharacterized protein n=1 Tax=Pythium oligandrum TaxID=41045 RepID=A0A8K1CTT3_PYTOL|nr:hypothetical protein Poli38472_001280 [Pythium oligandrum]|eukprot:TMW69124.1 hypothetical protein Poli38472_001280 [Pythium oligandrum]
MLKEEDAWRIALAWQERLQERVRLIPSHLKNRIVSTYEWVAFHVDEGGDLESQLELLHTFKAASTVWFVLSCCRGYSGRENPSFWKQVFGRLREPRLPSTEREQANSERHDEYYHPVTDVVQFFDEDDGLTFPRIQLFDHRFTQMNMQGALLELFFLGPKNPTSAMLTTERELAFLLNELVPFVVPSRSQRVIPVSLTPYMFYTMQRMLNLLSSLPTNPTLASTLPMSVHQPLFALQSINYWDTRIEDEASLAALKTFAQANPLELPFVILPSRQSRMLAPLCQIICGMDPAVQIQVKHGHCYPSGDAGFSLGGMCSALPHARSFKSLSLNSTLDAVDCAWIGYSLFHPDGPTASWSELTWRTEAVTMENMQTLEAMANGNNLLAIQFGLTPRSIAYSTAQLRSGSVIRVAPLFDGEVLLVMSEETSLDAARVLGDDMNELSDWVCVIVPTHGVGWVLAHNILRWTERAPAVASLKSLTIDSKNTTSDVLVRLLALVGSNLLALDVGSARIIDSRMMGLILQHCPSLESLRVCHDGSFWADNEFEAFGGPQLKSLALRLPRDPQLDAQVVSHPADSNAFADVEALTAPQTRQPCPMSTFRAPSKSATKTALRDLEALRLEAHVVTEFEQNRCAIKDVTLRLPILKYFHFSIDQNASKMLNEPLPYSDGRVLSWTMLGYPDQWSPWHKRGDTTLSFFSVVHHLSVRNSAAQRLGHDVLQLVLSFALSPPLDVWVDNDGKEVQWHR